MKCKPNGRNDLLLFQLTQTKLLCPLAQLSPYLSLTALFCSDTLCSSAEKKQLTSLCPGQGKKSRARLFRRCLHEKQNVPTHSLTCCTSKPRHLRTMGPDLQTVGLCAWWCLPPLYEVYQHRYSKRPGLPLYGVWTIPNNHHESSPFIRVGLGRPGEQHKLFWLQLNSIDWPEAMPFVHTRWKRI